MLLPLPADMPFQLVCPPAVAEVAVFMLPFNPINYLPGFYFGGLTAWIGQDILKARKWASVSYYT